MANDNIMHSSKVMEYIRNILADSTSKIVYCRYGGSYIKIIYYTDDVCHVEKFDLIMEAGVDDHRKDLCLMVKDPNFVNSANENLQEILVSIGLSKLAEKDAGIQYQYITELFKDGESLSEQRRRLSNKSIWFKYHYESESVLGIDPIIIETETDNTKYFDFIKVHVHCISHMVYGKSVQYQMVKNEVDIIDKMVLDKIKSSKRYNSYGVPINFLKCTSRVLRKDSILEYIFELKSVD